MRISKKLFLISFLILSIMIIVGCRANVYTVNFELNGGQPDIEAVEVLVGEKVSQPENPTKDGYSFGGWFIDSKFTQKYDFDIKVNNNYTLYAKWNVNKYSIYFDSKGGTSVETLTFDYNSELNKPEDPIKTGYIFDGWYIDEQYNTKFDWDSKMPHSNVTLYAKWEANKYEVIFTSLGVEIPELKQLVSYNTVASAPENPTRVGYTFKGWVLNGNEFDFNTIITKSITLSAVWEINEYTVSYNTNGGSEIDSVSYDYNETIQQPENPTKEGYTFAGWKLDGEVFSFTNAKMPAKNIELEAVWTANDYVISYNKNNAAATGSVANTDADYDSDVTISNNNYKLVGHTFIGWNTKADGNGVYYEEGSVAKNLASSGIFELYAIWAPNAYDVEFNANGGNGEMPDQEMTYGVSANLSLNTFTKDGYSFVGWSYEPNGMKVYNDGALYNATDDMVLYAVWKANTYEITFNANGGSGEMADLTATYDQNINLTKNSYENIGHKFIGWSTTIDGDVVYLDNASVINLVQNGNVTLYAKWEKISYKFTIYTNYANNEFTVVNYYYGDNIVSVEDPEIEGVNFIGWVDENGEAFSFTDAKMPASDFTIYAKWENEVVISFVSNGGSAVSSIVGYPDDTYTIPTSPLKEGYTFVGWYSDEELTISYELNGSMPTDDLTLYAKWDVNKYVVTYVTNGGSNMEATELDYNSTIEAIPTKEGYSFVGWYSDEDLNNIINKVPASNIIIYAKWNVNEYVVSYDANGGSGETVSQEVAYDESFKLQENKFVKEGYIFESWNTSADGSGDEYLEVANVSNLTAENNGEVLLYAIWTPIKYTIIFDANGGSGEIADLEISYNERVNLTANTFVKEGYTFDGWATSSAAISPDLLDEESILNITNINNAEITLYAIWVINKYTVNFISDGEIISTISNVNYGTNYSALSIPAVSKVGRTLTWTIDGSDVTNDYLIKSNIDIIAKYTNNTYTVSFVVNNKEVYTVQREYGAELDFSEYINLLDSNVKLITELLSYIETVMNGGSTDNLIAFCYNQEKMAQLQTFAPNSCIELQTSLGDPNKMMGIFSIVNTEKTNAETLLYSYTKNNGNPSLDGYVFRGWVLGEGTSYEDSISGDVFNGFVPASDIISEKAYIIASFAGIDPIDNIVVDDADDKLIVWDEVDVDSLGFSSESHEVTVEYEIYYQINSNELELMDVVNENRYQFMTDSTFSVPGQYKLFIIAVVTIKDKTTNNIEMVLSSTLADNAFIYLLSMSENNLDVDQSGDYYYRGTDESSSYTTFYFYTDMTYDFNTTNFVLVDEFGVSKEYSDVSILEGAQGNNSVIKTTNNTTAFYFKTSADSDRIFFAKVLPLISSFYFGKELTQFNNTKNGSSLFLNASESVYQIGAANTYCSVENLTSDYANNGFEFMLDVRTTGGEKINFKTINDFLVYKFYKYDETASSYVEVSNDEMGHYDSSTNAWEFIPTSGKYKVEISIKTIYVAPKLLEDGIIKPITFEFELNDRINVFSDKVFKNVFNNISENYRKGINLHANITPFISEKQKYTEEAVAAGNPFISGSQAGLRDGSTVNVGIIGLQNHNNPENIKNFTGNVYARVSKSDLNENYIVSGNLFNIEGSKLPYASIESAGNLSGVTGYKIANQQNAVFLYSVANYTDNYNCSSSSRLYLNDISINGNTSTPSLNSSSETELKNSIDIMNRNSGGYLGVFIGGGADLTVNNTVIKNTTIAIKSCYGDNNIVLDHFYTQSNWQNALFTQSEGNISISNSVLKDSGGAALHLEDRVSTTNNVLSAYVTIDQNTVIDNYVSGEEGYFKAYSLEFAVMQMKSSMNNGVETATNGAYTMLKTVIDQNTGLETQKVNFILLSKPTEKSNNAETGGTQNGNYGINVFDVSKGTPTTYNYSIVSGLENANAVIFNKGVMNGDTFVPTEGMLMSCNNIPGMGNAFIIAGVYLAQ